MPDTHRGLCSCWLKGGAGTWPVGGNTNRKFKEWLCEIVSQAGKLSRDTGGGGGCPKDSRISRDTKSQIQGEKWPKGSALRSERGSNGDRGNQEGLPGGSVVKDVPVGEDRAGLVKQCALLTSPHTKEKEHPFPFRASDGDPALDASCPFL